MASLENRGNGSWRVIISNGYGPDGKKQRLQRIINVDPTRTVNAQRKEVEKQAAIIEADYQRHLLTDSKKIRISEICDEYLEVHEMADSTRNWYRGLFKRIDPALGKIPVQDLTPKQIRDFYRDLSKNEALTARSKTGKLSGTYRLHYHRALSAILGFAVKSGYISVNPLTAVDPPRSDTPEAEFLEDTEIAEVMDVLENYDDPMWKAFFLMEMYMSMRPGEVIGLNWSDLDENLLSIRAGSNRVNGKTIRTDRPKNKSSKRTLVLPQEVMVPLKIWHKAQLEYKLQFGSAWPEESKDAMFTGPEGNRLDLSSPTQKWRKIQKKFNLKDAPLYSFRHTGASLLIASGMDVKEVSARLGHSRASTTLDKYTHLFEKAAQHTTDVMTDAIKKAREEFRKNGPGTPEKEAK